MEKKLSWEDIEKQYDQEWVELIDVDWPDEEIDPRSGVVRVHDRDREEFYRRLSELPALDSAVVFVGKPELPPNVLVGARRTITILPADA
jgi:hypothetical protein